MTQLSTEAKDRKAHDREAQTTLANEQRRGRRGLLAGRSTPAGQSGSTQESGIPSEEQASEPDLWDEGRAAARAGNHEKAIACFVREAEVRTRQGSHGRAAIAFRTAAEEARLQGQTEHCNQLLGWAATAYTHAAERSGLAPAAAHQAWISAAKCFLQLQQLDRATWCIDQARQLADNGQRLAAKSAP
jgi:hypothetical protein